MVVDRILPTREAEDLLALTRDLADEELAPRVEEHERAETYPDGLFATLGATGLLGLPYPEEYGGGAQPYPPASARGRRVLPLGVLTPDLGHSPPGRTSGWSWGGCWVVVWSDRRVAATLRRWPSGQRRDHDRRPVG